MRRGTTPIIEFTTNANLSGYDCYITLKQAGETFTFSGDRLQIVASENVSTIMLQFTQAETLAFEPGNVQVQLRAKKDDDAIASEIKLVNILNILKDGEI